MISKCAKCQVMNNFEMVESSPTGSRYKFYFIQCGACKTPVGVVDYFHTGTLIENNKQKIEELDRKVNDLQYSLDQIIRLLKQN